MLSDNVYIVVGGASGIGRATAKELASHGATVFVSDLGTSVHGEGASEAPAKEIAAEIREAGGEATTHFGNVSDFGDAEDLVETTVAEYGRVNGAVNFAGILRNSIRKRMDEDEWDAVTDVHLKGHFCLLCHLGTHWHERASDGDLDGKRSSVGVSSRSALGNVGQANYAAGKPGILGLIRSAVREFHRDGIRVNVLMPTVYTRIIENIPEDDQPFTCEEMPPERVATMVANLLSDAAKGVTGCTFWTGGDGIGLVEGSKQTRTAFHEGGWAVAEIAKTVEETLGQAQSLTKTGATF